LKQKWTADVEFGRRTSVQGNIHEGNQYRIANPAPLDLFAFGYTAILFMDPNTRWTETGTNQLGYSSALFLGGLTQLLVGMWEMYRNNMFGGTVFSFYGGLWLSYGIWGVLFHGAVFQSPLMYLHGLQMFVILWGIVSFIFFLATLVISFSLQAGGYFGIWTGAWAWYIASAELLNSVYRRQVLPLGIISNETKEPTLAGVDRPDTL